MMHAFARAGQCIRPLALALLLCGLIPAAPLAAQTPADPSLAELSTEAWRTASEQGLPDLWQRIRALPADDRAPALATLRQEIEAHESHLATRRRHARAAYERSMSDFRVALGEENISKALLHAVEASGLAEDPDGFLADQKIADLTARAEQEAARADVRGDWFRALMLYRRLELLYEHQSRYKDDLQRVARKMRILRTYAPDAYYAQATAFAEDQGDDPPRRWEDESETWRTELKDIDMSMLRQALTHAADKHVEASNYQELLTGGIDGLRVLLEVEPLGETFPGLKSMRKVEQFDEALLEIRRDIARRSTWMGYSQARQTLDQIKQASDRTVELPEAVLIHEFADGAMSTLDDFSGIIWPSERERFERTTKQEFSGVGIQITLTDGELTVVSPLEDTPAHRAGIKAGDRITAIDGKGTTGITLEQAVRHITGPEGTTVTLGIRAAGSEHERDVTLTRRTIKITSVKGFQRQAGGAWDYFIDPDARIGYIRLTQFGPDTAVEMDHALAAMKQRRALRRLDELGVDHVRAERIVRMNRRDAGDELRRLGLTDRQRDEVLRLIADPQPIEGLVLDLRFNPGGLLKAAVEVADRFVEDGVIVSGHAGGAADAWSERADARDTYADFPVVVLINRGSASASEIVAGALQDHRRGLIVGENSYGKGSVQQLFPLRSGGWGAFNSFVKVTTQYYKLPSGRIIHRRPDAEKWGVAPDVPVPMTDMQVSQLIKARMIVDVLKDADDPDIDPASVIGREDDEQTAGPKLGEDLPLPRDAAEVLEFGYDPQLEAAVLLLKARLIGDLAAG